MARKRMGGLIVPTPGQVTAAARGDYGIGGQAQFLALYGAVVGLDIFRRGGLGNVDRDRFAGYFGGGFAFMLLAWYQPGLAGVILVGVLIIQLLNVLPDLADWFNRAVVGRLADAGGVPRAPVVPTAPTYLRTPAGVPI